MNVGLPGTGIAGIFYLLAALWMPFHAIVRAATGCGSAVRRRAVLRQTALALGIILALVATAWFLDLALAALMPSAPADAELESAAGADDPRVRPFGVLPTVLTFTTLAVVLLGVEVLRLVVGPKRGRVRAS